MHATEDNDRISRITGSKDFLLLAENIADLVLFTIEKHEFKTNSTLSEEVREDAIAHIGDVLQSRIKEMDPLRRKLLVSLFRAAENALEEVVQKHQRD